MSTEITQRGVCSGTRVITPPPGPLPKYGEGEKSRMRMKTGSPSPSLGKGPGDGVLTPIELIRAGDLVLTHRNRFMPVLDVNCYDYQGEIVEIELDHCCVPLRVAPGQMLAACAPPLPDYQTALPTVRSLRGNPTQAEMLLWERLREKQTGTKFRRQQPMGRFVLDFYAPEVRLAVEVDGGVHCLADQKEYDEFRQQLVEQHMIEFVRFTNDEIVRSPVRAAAAVVVKVTSRRSRFDYGIQWINACEADAGTRIFRRGSQEMSSVRSIGRSVIAVKMHVLRLGHENSFVTETCTFRC